MLRLIRRCFCPRPNHQRTVPRGTGKLQLEPRRLCVEEDQWEGQLSGSRCGNNLVHEPQQHGAAESRYDSLILTDLWISPDERVLCVQVPVAWWVKKWNFLGSSNLTIKVEFVLFCCSWTSRRGIGCGTVLTIRSTITFCWFMDTRVETTSCQRWCWEMVRWEFICNGSFLKIILS